VQAEAPVAHFNAGQQYDGLPCTGAGFCRNP